MEREYKNKDGNIALKEAQLKKAIEEEEAKDEYFSMPEENYYSASTDPANMTPERRYKHNMQLFQIAKTLARYSRASNGKF